MIELELYVDPTHWNQSWLFNSVEISSADEHFTGTITAEIFSWVDPETIRCLFTIEATPQAWPSPTPSVITAHNTDYPNVQKLSPSAGTAWPIPEHTELLLSHLHENPSQVIALGTLYNHANTDVISTENNSHHVLRANAHTAFLIDDATSAMHFIYDQTHLTLTKDYSLKNPNGIFSMRGKGLTQTSQKNTREHCGENYTRTITDHFISATQHGNIIFHANQGMRYHTSQQLLLSAGKTLLFESDRFLHLCQKNMNLTSTKGVILNSEEDIDIQAGKTVTIIGEKTITLSQGGNTLTISSDEISLTADQITVSGQVILSVKPT